MRTFEELRDMADTCSHFSHVHDYHTERFRYTASGSIAYHAEWSGIELYYHLSVDQRCFA